MRHNLNIRVSDKPRNGGVVACRTVSIREKLFTPLLGPKQKVMVVVPGNSVESISNDHKREKREKEQASRDLEYHEKRMKEFK